MPSKFVAVYMRVSSNRQDTKSQEPDLQNWVSVYAKDEEVRFFREKHEGSTMQRPIWEKVEAAIRKGHVSQVVIWRVDRLGRTAAGLTKLFAELRKRKVGFISVQDGIDLSTAAGRMLANVLAAISEFENDIRSEKTKAGQALARKRGVKIGGGKAGRRCTMTAEQEDQIVKLAKEGKSKAYIARASSVSRPWVYQVLRRHGLYEPQVLTDKA